MSEFLESINEEIEMAQKQLRDKSNMIEESKAVQELRRAMPYMTVIGRQAAESVLAELAECNEQRLTKTRELVVATLKLSDCEKQLSAAKEEAEHWRQRVIANQYE